MATFNTTSINQQDGTTAGIVNSGPGTVSLSPAPPAKPKPWWKRWQGIALAVLAVAGAGAETIHKLRGKDTEMGDKPIIFNTTSINQQNGITAGQIINVHPEPPQRHLHPDLRAGLLSGIPKEKPVKVYGANNDSESMAFAREIRSFLQDSGFKVERDVYPHMFFNVPPNQVTVNINAERGTETWITIGAAR